MGERANMDDQLGAAAEPKFPSGKIQIGLDEDWQSLEAWARKNCGR